jgi:hypothetical protein
MLFSSEPKYQTRIDASKVLDLYTGNETVRNYLADMAFELLEDQITLPEMNLDWDIEIAWDEDGVIVGLFPEGYDDEQSD